MDKDWNEIEEAERIYLCAVFIDMVGSTDLYNSVGKEEATRRKEFFRRTADRVFEERFKAEGRTGWQGEGATFFFTSDDIALKASIAFIGELRTGLNVEVNARISIGSGLAKLKGEWGKQDEKFISDCGHLNSACPENAILITDDVYDSLSDDLKKDFTLCGTTKRDNIITFIYPKEKKSKKNPKEFLKRGRRPLL